MKKPGEDAGRLAVRIAKQSIWLAGFAAAGLILLPAAALGWGSGSVSAALCSGIAVAAGLSALALSALLRFDAALFQLMASHGDEVSGGMRVDEFLARAGLKAEPAVIRRLADRAAGTSRIQTFQHAALLLFMLFMTLTFTSLAFA